jgi:hypothetical protein
VAGGALQSLQSGELLGVKKERSVIRMGLMGSSSAHKLTPLEINLFVLSIFLLASQKRPTYSTPYLAATKLR